MRTDDMKSKQRSKSGFTLIETMIVLFVMSLFLATVFQQIGTVQQRAQKEQQSQDLLQESREFMDQMTRDFRNAGYPSGWNFEPSTVVATTDTAATGLKYVGDGDLWFEGDVDGNGTIYLVKYQLDKSTTGNCPCLRRSKISKTAINAGVVDTNYSIEVQNVSTANPIFQYFDADGVQIPSASLPLDSSADALGGIQTIKVTLTVQAKYADMKTGVKPALTFVSSVMLNNCSLAGSAGPAGKMKC